MKIKQLDNREDFEVGLSDRMGDELRRQFAAVMGRIENDEPVDDQDFWNAETVLIATILTPFLADIYTESASLFLGAQAGVIIKTSTIAAGAVNARAAEWATTYSFELVSGINQTTRMTLQREIERAFNEGLSISNLRDRLSNTFGLVRADMIATTETTRATVEGSRAFVRELERDGSNFDDFWLTAGDGRVCKICEPLDGQLRVGGQYHHPRGMVFTGPPAHTRCRCDEIHEPVLVEALFQERIREEGPAIEPSPLSDNFIYRESKLSPHIDHSLQALDDVFETGDFDFGETKVSGYTGRGEGRFNPETGKIQINRAAQHKEFTFLHETGHAMDYNLLPQALDIDAATASLGSSFSDTPTAMDGLWKAIDESDAIKKLQSIDDPTSMEYLLDVREVYARSFSQYIVESSGDPLLLEQLDETREWDFYPEQWTTEDFAPIKSAFDDMFEAFGMLN